MTVLAGEYIQLTIRAHRRQLIKRNIIVAKGELAVSIHLPSRQTISCISSMSRSYGTHNVPSTSLVRTCTIVCTVELGVTV